MSQVLRPLLVFGTRPEAIKMAPVVRACEEAVDAEAIVCLSGQHREMLHQVTDYFGIKADFDLNLMQPNQTLAGLTSRCFASLDETIETAQPSCVVAQGDTTTVMVAATCAFYRKIPFVHVEAGLRTGNVYSPWPEEFNRRVTGVVASLHCAPTQRSADNLLKEGVSASTVHVTGNTVIDALLETVARERNNPDWQAKYSFLSDQRMVLITGHRRENFGAGFRQICEAILTLAKEHNETHFIYPVHLNPNVREVVHEMLGGQTNVHLIPPVPYPEFVWLMDRCFFLISDSGGVQEEAPSLKKPVLVMRDTTERPEAVDAGACELVGTDTSRIVNRATALLADPTDYARHLVEHNPYGDGQAASRIVQLMTNAPWAPTRK